MVRGRSHQSQLLESWQNQHGLEVLDTLRRARETSTLVPGFGQQKRTDTSPRQHSAARCATNVAEAERIGLENSAASDIHAGLFAHRLPLFQISRQFSTGKMLQKPR